MSVLQIGIAMPSLGGASFFLSPLVSCPKTELELREMTSWDGGKAGTFESVFVFHDLTCWFLRANLA